jgi:hypothetical protein
MKKHFASVLLAGVGSLTAGSAGAYSVYYGEVARGADSPPLSTSQLGGALVARDEFFSALAGSMIPAPRVENFESALNTDPNGNLRLVFGEATSREVTATLLASQGSVVTVPEGTSVSGRYSVPGGSKFWQSTTTDTSSTFEIWFDNDVEAFGFFGIDIGDFGGTLELDLLSGNASNSVVVGSIVDEIAGQLQVDCGPGGDPDCNPYDPYNGSVRYVGVQAENESQFFRGIRFRAVLDPNLAASVTTAADLFAFDSFSVVGVERTPPTTVSVPGTLSLLATALMGLALVRRRA